MDGRSARDFPIHHAAPGGQRAVRPCALRRQVEAEQYDGGGAGDSNLTQLTEKVDSTSSHDRVTQFASDWRDRPVSEKDGYQSTEDTSTHRPLFYASYDNLGEVTKIDRYDGDTVQLSALGSTAGVPNAPSSSLRRAETTIASDEQGRVYRSTVFPVDPSTGSVGSYGLATNTYRDHRGNIIETAAPGGVFTKDVFDGAGRNTVTYTTDGAGGTGYADPVNGSGAALSNDHVLEQITRAFDADSSVTQTADALRDNDYTTAGALAANTTNHQDRVSYGGNWFDLADRLTASEDVGTNGGSAWTRPSSPDTRSDTALVSGYGYLADNVQTVRISGIPTGGTFTLTYNGHTTGSLAYNASAATVQTALAGLTGVGAGNVAVTSSAPWTYTVRFMGALGAAYRSPITASNSLTGGTSPSVTAVESIPGGDAGIVQTTTDPRNIVALADHDLLGRTTATVADFSAGAPSSSTDQTTAYTFNGDEHTLTQTAVMPTGTPNQTTAYAFGVTTTGGSTVNSDDLLAKVEYPTKTGATAGQPSTAASDDVAYTADRQGEALTRTDQNQTVHTLGRDLLGRQTSDSVAVASGNPQGVDLSVLDRTAAYDTQGNPYLFTDYNTATPVIGTTTPLSQVQDGFNNLGQLTTEYQNQSGAVNTSTTPKVQYTYAGPSSTQNYSRVTALTYPDGRIVHYVYNSGIDDNTSRVSTVADDNGSGGVGGHLADYSYLGPDMVVTEAQGNGNSLTTVQQSNDGSALTTAGAQYGGDEYTGLDRFGRVVDQNYVQTYTGIAGSGGTAPSSTDRFQSLYDRDGNALYRNNLVNTAFGELYHANSTTANDNATAYDNLNRLPAFSRGALSASGHNGSGAAGYDTVSTASATASWSLDALGNWTSSTANGTNTTRGNDSRNEQTTVGAATLGFDNNGDTTTDEQGRKLLYGPWGDLSGVVNTTTNHQTTYSTDALGRRATQQDATRTDAGPVLAINNGSAQRSMVDSLTVVFPYAVTLTGTGAFTLTNTTTSTTVTTTYSNPSGDGKTWLISYTGTGNSLADGVYTLTLTYADITAGASTSGISADRTWTFHRLFGDLNGNATVASTDPSDNTVFNAAYGTSTGSPLYEPAFDYDHNGIINSIDYSQFRNRYNANSGAGTTYSYTNSSSSPILAGASTTAPVGQTDISAWAANNALNLYNDPAGRVIEERPAAATGASKQFVWGLSYVNDLLEQDTATATASGGNLPATHLLTYALDPSFNSTGTLVGPTGSFDGVAIQPADNKVVVAGVSGTSLIINRYYANGTADTSFGSSGSVTLSETSPTFCRLALDSSGNIVVAVDSGGAGGPVQVSRLTPSGTLDTTFNSTGQATITFATAVVPQGIALQADGKIDVVADSTAGAGIYLARLTTAGALDSAFGSSGEVNAPLSRAPSVLSIALDPSGKVLVGGSDGGDISVVRLTTAGALDTTFNTTGEAKANFGATDVAYAVSPGPNGTVVAAGYSNSSGTYNHAIARWTSSGSLDSTFGSSGEVLGTGGTGVIRAMLVEPNGSILAGGDANGTTAQKVWKFTSSGAADSEFASGGSLTANSGATVYGWAITSGPTQRVVVAGSYNGNAALAAFAPASLRLYAQHDANYDITAYADANGTVQERFVYDPYGSVTVLSPQWTTTTDSFGVENLFQGMRYDPATGLYHTPNREYSSTLGRWMQQDPDGYIDGNSLFPFVGNDPIDMADPSGLTKGDKLYGLPKAFWKWYHRQEKDKFDPDLTKEEAEELAEDWKGLGKPDAEGKPTETPPTPFWDPGPTKSTEGPKPEPSSSRVPDILEIACENNKAAQDWFKAHPPRLAPPPSPPATPAAGAPAPAASTGAPSRSPSLGNYVSGLLSQRQEITCTITMKRKACFGAFCAAVPMQNVHFVS